MEYQHESVMLQQAVDALAINGDGVYVDATFGRGGHSREILKQLGQSGRLVVIDQDEEAIKDAKVLETHDQRVTAIHGSFSQITKITDGLQISGKVKGILFDIGVSSPQLDDNKRGFSFLRDGPLDMRMDQSKGITAAEWLAEVDETTLIKVLKEYGEERFARRIARAIIEARAVSPITTTKQLALLITEAIPVKEKHKHPATRSFQAIRIFINHELEEIKQALEQSLEVLAAGGRLVVISFHSLEDRLVKRFMRDQAKGKQLPRNIVVPQSECEQRLKIIGKAIKASVDEVAGNVRSRSAVLRTAEKIL